MEKIKLFIFGKKAKAIAFGNSKKKTKVKKIIHNGKNENISALRRKQRL